MDTAKTARTASTPPAKTVATNVEHSKLMATAEDAAVDVAVKKVASTFL